MKGEVIRTETSLDSVVVTIRFDDVSKEDMSRLMRWFDVGFVEITGFKFVLDKEEYK